MSLLLASAIARACCKVMLRFAENADARGRRNGRTGGTSVVALRRRLLEISAACRGVRSRNQDCRECQRGHGRKDTSASGVLSALKVRPAAESARTGPPARRRFRPKTSVNDAADSSCRQSKE